jgi:hypothetical protein
MSSNGDSKTPPSAVPSLGGAKENLSRLWRAIRGAHSAPLSEGILK